MSFYHPLLTAVAALTFALPVFADVTPTSTEQSMQPAASSQVEAPKVDINKAIVKELTHVKGITPAKAKAIVSYRKKNGEFKSLDDLKKVKGFKKMSPDQLNAIEDQLTTG